MRNVFAREVTALAGEDPRLVFLSGDIGNRLFDDFKAAHPERFFNCGVAEANMMGMAAGLALSGLRPVVYTIVPFVTTRCFEQIRVDLCYHKAPVVVVGVGGGLSYASLGATHHSCEDIALLRMLPEMSVICPGDAHEVPGALRAALAHDGPVYIRLGKKGEPLVHEGPVPVKLGRSITVREGRDVALLSTGNLLPTTVDAAERLEARGVSARVESFHTVKPLDQARLAEVFDGFPLVVTVEEHSQLGGLGGSVAEWLADRPSSRARLLRIGTPDSFVHECGSQSHARRRLGLEPDAIASQVQAALRRATRGASRGAATDRAVRPRIGRDIDHTIVCYDRLFHRLALERQLIPEQTPATKQAVRDALRAAGREEDWIELQGIAYGLRMSEADPFPGVHAFMAACVDREIDLFIVSHKTARPFKGPRVDLRSAALTWLAGEGFLGRGGTGIDRGRVFFEPTKAAKIERIRSLGLTHFVDDLPEFLTESAFPADVRSFLFDPAGTHDGPAGGDRVFSSARSWSDLERLLLGEAQPTDP